MMVLSSLALWASCNQTSVRKPIRSEMGFEAQHYDDQVFTGKDLIVKASARPLVVGRHQSLQIDFHVDPSGEWVEYRILDAQSSPSSKSMVAGQWGKSCLGPILIHDLDAGVYLVELRACRKKDDSLKGDSSEKLCGVIEAVSYMQPKNSDPEIMNLLLERQKLLEAQRDMADEYVDILRLYPNGSETTQDPSPLKDNISTVVDAGKCRVGDLLVSSPELLSADDLDAEEGEKDSSISSDSQQSEESTPKKKKKKEHIRNSSIALLTILAATVARYINPISLDALRKQHFEIMNDVEVKRVEWEISKTNLQYAKDEVKYLEEELRNSAIHSERREALSKLRQEAEGRVADATKQTEINSSLYHKTVRTHFKARPSTLRTWGPRALGVAALAAAGITLYLYPGSNDSLEGSLNSSLETVATTFGLAANGRYEEFHTKLDEFQSKLYEAQAEVRHLDYRILEYLESL